MNKKAVCLISGGLDSCVCAYIAKKENYEIYGLTFNYAQRHKKEINCSKKICELLNVKKHIIFDLELDKFGGSSLVDKKILPEKNHKINEIGKIIPSTYVPARNTIFLSIALAYAETINADAIFIGINSIDFSGYPDCRPEYIKAFQKMADLSTKQCVEGKKIVIKIPLIKMDKAEIIKKGLELKVPFNHTWSCYYGKDKACGKCDSCLLRLKGFNEAGVKDPIPYLNDIS